MTHPPDPSPGAPPPVPIVIQAAAPASRLDKAQKWATIGASVLLPVIVLILGAVMNASLKDRELAVKYVEIAAGILSTPRLPENENLHDWAERTVNRHAAEKLPEAALKEVRDGQPLVTTPAGQCDPGSTPGGPDRTIRYIIVTDTESPSLAGTRAMVCRRAAQVSYHFLIGTDGTVEQLVPVADIAWHAGRSSFGGDTNLNRLSIGIGLIHLATADGQNWLNLPADHPAVGPRYPDAQLDALVGLLERLAVEHRISPSNIVTKQDIAPDRRRSDLFGAPMAAIRTRLVP
ncbi:MAG: N-acetylmuramoyl-L-alanine amidase [Gemmobacter sp.]